VTGFGVGFVGAGVATQAIHVPTLRSFGGAFRFVGCMDADGSTARRVASQLGCAWTTDVSLLLGDPDVEIVVVGSPDAYHADQIVAACEAGKRGILAEKPLVLTDLDVARVRRAVMESDAKLIVGTMHAYDSIVLSALNRWETTDVQARYVDVRCYLPDNEEMISLATQVIAPDAKAMQALRLTEMEIARGGITSLASHDIPMLRRLVPDPLALDAAGSIHPWGYYLHGQAGDAVVRIVGMMGGHWQPDWSLCAVANDAVLRINFPPSFVSAGAARATIATRDQAWSWTGDRSGYHGEWEEMLRVLRDGREPRFSLDDVLGDTRYALDLVAQVPLVWQGARHV